jgi:hypothetical protein
MAILVNRVFYALLQKRNYLTKYSRSSSELKMLWLVMSESRMLDIMQAKPRYNKLLVSIESTTCYVLGRSIISL